MYEADWFGAVEAWAVGCIHIKPEWQFGLMITMLVVSTQLLYVNPG